MSKGNTYETDILALLFNATPISGVADNAASSPLTVLEVALHTADPGEGGNQTTSECAYTSYARIPVNRNSGGWTVASGSVSPAANISFIAATGGSETATHFSVGSAHTGTGKIFYSGTLTPNVTITTGVQPVMTTATAITED